MSGLGFMSSVCVCYVFAMHLLLCVCYVFVMRLVCAGAPEEAASRGGSEVHRPEPNALRGSGGGKQRQGERLALAACRPLPPSLPLRGFLSPVSPLWGQRGERGERERALHCRPLSPWPSCSLTLPGQGPHVASQVMPCRDSPT